MTSQKKAINLANTVDSRKTSKKNARYYSKDYCFFFSRNHRVEIVKVRHQLVDCYFPRLTVFPVHLLPESFYGKLKFDKG